MFLESTDGKGENCQGDSGSPILRMTRDEAGNKLLTGETYGVLQGSTKLYPVSERKYCATYFAARPNN